MAFKKTVKKYVTKKNVIKGAKFAYKHRGTAQKALKLAMRLKDAVNIEYKEVEERILYGALGDGQDDPAVPDSVKFKALCLPSLGTGENDRIGTSIKLQRLSGRGRISWLHQEAPAGGRLTASVRVILMRGKADEGRTYPVTDVLTPTDKLPYLDERGTLGAKADNTKFNTKTIFDRTYKLDVAKTNMINLNWNFPLNWHQNFMENVGGDRIADNGLYLAVVTDTGTDALCEFVMNYSCTYTDD